MFALGMGCRIIGNVTLTPGRYEVQTGRGSQAITTENWAGYWYEICMRLPISTMRSQVQLASMPPHGWS